MSHPSGKDHWMNRKKIQVNEFYKSVGAVSAMLTDFPPSDLKNIVAWGQHIIDSNPLWYRKKFKKAKP